jgi:hypothetical protein
MNVENLPNHEALDQDIEDNLALSKTEYIEIINKVRKEMINQEKLLHHFRIGIS